jgi:hypothetical protein
MGTCVQDEIIQLYEFSVWLDINITGIFYCFRNYFVGRILLRITRFLNLSIVLDLKKIHIGHLIFSYHQVKGWGF